MVRRYTFDYQRILLGCTDSNVLGRIEYDVSNTSDIVVDWPR